MVINFQQPRLVIVVKLLERSLRTLKISSSYPMHRLFLFEHVLRWKDEKLVVGSGKAFLKLSTKLSLHFKDLDSIAANSFSNPSNLTELNASNHRFLNIVSYNTGALQDKRTKSHLTVGIIQQLLKSDVEDKQCDQMGQLIKLLGNKFSYKSIVVIFWATSNDTTFM